jgi:hypothetical protein
MRFFVMIGAAWLAPLVFGQAVPTPLGGGGEKGIERELLEAVRGLSAQVERLNESQLNYPYAPAAVPAPVVDPYTSAAAAYAGPSCGYESAPAVGYLLSSSCAPVRSSRRALVEPPLLLSERDCALARRRQLSLEASRAAWVDVASGRDGAGCDSCASAAGYSAGVDVGGYSWRSSFCDALRGRTVRQVGPYAIEVRHGLFSSEITVVP